MALNKVELAGLTQKAISGKLSKKESVRLTKELAKKFEKQGLDTFTERVILASFLLSDDLRAAMAHIQLLMDGRVSLLQDE